MNGRVIITPLMLLVAFCCLLQENCNAVIVVADGNPGTDRRVITFNGSTFGDAVADGVATIEIAYVMNNAAPTSIDDFMMFGSDTGTTTTLDSQAGHFLFGSQAESPNDGSPFAIYLIARAPTLGPFGAIGVWTDSDWEFNDDDPLNPTNLQFINSAEPGIAGLFGSNVSAEGLEMFAAVPEPHHYTMAFALGLLGLGFISRYRKLKDATTN